MKVKRFKVDKYSIKLYANDRKGSRTRWGDKVIEIYSDEKHVASAVFARKGATAPEPYFSDGKIYYFAQADQYAAVIDLLRNDNPVYIVWEPVYDQKEPNDGDAYFYVEGKVIQQNYDEVLEVIKKKT